MVNKAKKRRKGRTARLAGSTSRRPSAIPLGQRIRRDIETRILSGVWAPGHRIPFEHELMRKYGCARMTVSKALASLADSGLIERRRRAGSFVRSLRNQTAVLQVPDIRVEIIKRGYDYAYKCLHARTRKSSVAEFKQDGVPAGTPVLAISCLHFANEVPYVFEERRIFLDAVPCAAGVDFGSEPPGSWLLRHIAWHEAQHRISAVAATRELIKLLDLKSGAACLKVERATWVRGKMLTAVRLWYPGTTQTLVARFTQLQRAP